MKKKKTMRDKTKYARSLTRLGCLLILVSACWLVLPSEWRRRVEAPALAASLTFIVNTNDDADDSACNVTHCSLREAINAANANVGDDTINFNIPGTGVHTIAPASALPDITDSVTIDGYSQPRASPNTLAVGTDGILLIELNGAGIDANGLRISNGASTIKGLVINRFNSDCIDLLSDGNVIEGNFLGTDPTGTVAYGKPGNGVTINFSKNNTIGGITTASRNLISGNDTGVIISNNASSGNKVQNNCIGTTASGTEPLGNSWPSTTTTFLNRQHDVSGLNFWTNQIESCGNDLACIQVRRVNVSAAFFLSIEFQETGFLVIRTQRAAFGRMSDNSATRLTYLQFLRQARKVGDGLIVGSPGWQQKLEANRQAYAEHIVGSAEFITMYPLTMTAAEYVDALFSSAGVVPTAVERQDAINAFGASDRTAALRNVVDSPSLRSAEMRAAFVLMQYFGYLRRNPTDAPDTNDSGYQFWLSKLNQFNGDFVAAEMVKAFISSTEYRQRFGLP